MTVRIEVSREAGTPSELAGVDLERLVDRAARATMADRGVAEAELSVTLLDDDAMTAMNRTWRQKGAATDVLAFTLSEPGEPPLGDVYVGVQQAVRQAGELGEGPARELARLTIHGALHVLGFDHPDQDREDSEMWAHQERILAGLEV